MKKTAKIILAGLTAVGILALGVTPILAGSAGDINLGPGGGGFAPLVKLTFPNLIQGIIRIVLIIAALMAFAFLIFGGIMWITSGGDKGKTEAARNTITAALVGLLIVFAAWAIIRLIEVLFSVTILNMTIPVINGM